LRRGDAENMIGPKRERLTGHWGRGIMMHNEDLHNLCPLQNFALNADIQSACNRHAKCRSVDIHENIVEGMETCGIQQQIQ
jgi:hypothetical protein